jgi:hypothetical protein
MWHQIIGPINLSFDVLHIGLSLFGRILGINVKDLSVSKTNWLHFDIF